MNRSGLYTLGSEYTSSMRCANAGDVATMCPLGTTNFLPFVVSTSKGTLHCLRSMMRGGCILSASLMQKWSSSIWARISKSILSPCFAITSFCSFSSLGKMRSLLAMDSRPVQVEVMEDVCCPAKSTAMSMPNTWSLESLLPSLYRASMNVWRTSGSMAPLSLRPWMTLSKMAASSLRALSLLRCASMGA